MLNQVFTEPYILSILLLSLLDLRLGFSFVASALYGVLGFEELIIFHLIFGVVWKVVSGSISMRGK